VLHPTVDTDFFKPLRDREAVRRQFALDGRQVLLTVAHLVRRKGHEQVIQALPALKAIHPNVIYLVVGRGPCESHLRDLAEDLGVSEAVRFCGYVPARELPRYYGAADIYIMASTCDGDVEGFGISFIEAAACGTPSVGSRAGGIPDAIADGETGFLVEPGDVQGLSTSILRMLRNTDSREQMGLAARIRVEKLFSKAPFDSTLWSALRQTVLSGKHPSS
jgi:phosphatidylinositol alpha-1,6-mannosyltransferase